MLPQESSEQTQVQRTSGMAVASMVLGIVALVFSLALAGFAILGVLAVIFGHVALDQMKKDQALTGRGMAIAGLATGYVGIGIIALIVLLVGVAA